MKQALLGLCLGLALVAYHQKPANAEESQSASADALSVMTEFWSLVEANRFSETEKLMAKDIVFIDPIWGRFEGREAAANFMKSFDGNGNGCCTLDRLVGSETAAWGLWTLHGPDEAQPWVGVYEVENGKITYYQDIHQRTYSDEEKAARTNASPAAQQ